MNKPIAVVLFLVGCFSYWYWPSSNGLFLETVSIFITGAAILWFMPQPKDGA